ncbi:MAG: two pore domain potassium channel family protein [Pseudomonadales bacterium]|nr:two pore domain potassium channel family protein [Pseudomonadales bacterium]
MIVARWFARRRYFRFSRHIAGAIRRRLIRAICLFLVLFAVHVLVMMTAEGYALGDAAWLTITTATTVGYGDISADTLIGRTATTLCMYVFGIFLLAQIATDVFDYRTLQRDRRRRGQLEWKNMKDHLLVINVPTEHPEAYLARLVADVRNTPQLADIPVQLLTTSFPEGLPTTLVNEGVTHYTAVAENTESLRAAKVSEARHIVVIAGESNDPRADALTYDILSRIADIRTKASIVVEAVDDGNRQRLLDAGATTVVRPVRAYPEIVVRAMIEPGTEQVLENLFTHEADRLARFDAEFANLRWRTVVSQFVQGGAGLPLGYVDSNGVHTNPSPDAICTGEGIITLIKDAAGVTREAVEDCLRKCAA